MSYICLMTFGGMVLVGSHVHLVPAVRRKVELAEVLVCHDPSSLKFKGRTDDERVRDDEAHAKDGQSTDQGHVRAFVSVPFIQPAMSECHHSSAGPDMAPDTPMSPPCY